jgi:hypothetical protein
VIKEVIDKRKATPKNDLVSMLVKNPEYQGKDDLIADEVIGVFLTGIEPVQCSSSNMIMNAICGKTEIKKKVLHEIDSLLLPYENELMLSFTLELAD